MWWIWLRGCAGGLQGEVAQARLAVQRLLQLGVVLGSVLVGGLLAGHTVLPMLFSRDPAVITQAGGTLMIIAFSMVHTPGLSIDAVPVHDLRMTCAWDTVMQPQQSSSV